MAKGDLGIMAMDIKESGCGYRDGHGIKVRSRQSKVERCRKLLGNDPTLLVLICQQTQFQLQVRVEAQGTSTKGADLNLRECTPWKKTEGDVF